MDIARTLQPPPSLHDAPLEANPDAVEHSELANAYQKQADCCHPSPSLDMVAHKFMENMKDRFGEQSSESNTIHGILGAFSARRITKRDAHSAIVLTLRNHEDLKQNLMDVLFHKDANWGPGDFDIDQCFPQRQPQLPLSPQLLQPTHQPQVRMPSMSSAWYPGSQTFQSINPATLHSYGAYAGFENQEPQEPQYASYGNIWHPQTQFGPSSPIVHMSEQFQYSHHSASPAMQQAARFPPYTSANYSVNYSLPQDAFDNDTHQQPHSNDQRERTGYSNWTTARSIHPSECTPSLTSDNLHLSAPSYGVRSPHMSSPVQKFPDAAPSMLGIPIAIPIGQPAVDMQPPSKKRPRKESVTHVKPKTQVEADDDVECEERSHSPVQGEPSPTRRLSDTRPSVGNSRRQSQGQGRFIHNLCGKGFSTRSKVKQHHWGKKNNDLATKTGCWAKYKKPNVSWDAHPSCKEESARSHSTKQMSFGEPRKNSAQPVLKREANNAATSSPKTLAIAIMKTNDQQIIPGFSTLQDLPGMVAQALHPRALPQYSLDEAQIYHSHRLPSRGNFDALLTAANVASKIDAPKPLSRHDSVVSHLDAQAVIAERNMQHTPTWAFPYREQEHPSFRYSHYHLPPVAVSGLGISKQIYGNGQVPHRMLASSQVGQCDYASPSIPSESVEPEDGMDFAPCAAQSSLRVDSGIENHEIYEDGHFKVSTSQQEILPDGPGPEKKKLKT
ncbi:hypothetical protein P153DRAFT_384724 [Dothidotthia symphoricarpi CBS 119687]|uniref:Uncharacterized protein n=1 Tax=Dothidotthia symphoricarpi CBS 119687 TaxID=1392245 RepID=A0A6A6AH82_9PLEO|nr:uncharacterized protein P153DRAFT_384724 [Dothidotthia symphoricarpi CBS 119687]KAF2130455.1 hypothetical protein P153DRAFT_384724 [Dothidotthia symphoricarpi CBS 119687]